MTLVKFKTTADTSSKTFDMVKPPVPIECSVTPLLVLVVNGFPVEFATVIVELFVGYCRKFDGISNLYSLSKTMVPTPFVNWTYFVIPHGETIETGIVPFNASFAGFVKS